MKYQTTRKAIVYGSSKIRFAYYCEIQTLLQAHSPVAYTAGIYGWNFDVYEIDGVTICTGYRNMPGTHANNAREYEQRANAIMNEHDRKYESRRDDVEKLLHEFIAQI